ncbi:hypothetical protein H8B02_13325 [Bradyrhizobium sp. Pear77]|uniref:hypothetical protein n=1 Tax=Bradyrhizobium altum TaxID=1571202 RepID=UPI001E3F00FA|nr:hypothetical protein [Bradyrhizobium altum]MCC8954394.1 hypothetical protein [Bradyrhizobium altum]
MFDIKNSKDFLEKLYEDYADYESNRKSARLAINAALTSYHLAEWVWGDWLKTDYATWRKLGIRDEDTFKAWLDKECFYFPVMQRIANGSKHFVRSEQKSTLKSGGYGEGGYGAGGYGEASLQIEVINADGDSVWLDAQGLIEDVLIFWREFFKEYSPYKDDMPRHGHLMYDFKD